MKFFVRKALEVKLRSSRNCMGSISTFVQIYTRDLTLIKTTEAISDSPEAKSVSIFVGEKAEMIFARCTQLKCTLTVLIFVEETSSRNLSSVKRCDGV